MLNLVWPSSVRTKRKDSFLMFTKLFRGLVGSPASGGGYGNYSIKKNVKIFTIQ